MLYIIIVVVYCYLERENYKVSKFRKNSFFYFKISASFENRAQHSAALSGFERHLLEEIRYGLHWNIEKDSNCRLQMTISNIEANPKSGLQVWIWKIKMDSKFWLKFNLEVGLTFLGLHNLNSSYFSSFRIVYLFGVQKTHTEELHVFIL